LEGLVLGAKKMTITKGMVENFIRHHPGCTQKDIARAFPTGSKIYGSHKFVATRIGELREEGKLPDVERCETCKRATTRGRKNLKLYLIDTGETEQTLF
jgi:hypothetical protein